MSRIRTRHKVHQKDRENRRQRSHISTEPGGNETVWEHQDQLDCYVLSPEALPVWGL